MADSFRLRNRQLLVATNRYKQSKFIDKLKFDNMYWIEITQYVVNNLSDNEKLEQIQEMQNKTGFNSGE